MPAALCRDKPSRLPRRNGSVGQALSPAVAEAGETEGLVKFGVPDRRFAKSVGWFPARPTLHPAADHFRGLETCATTARQSARFPGGLT
jgi:hypothetical protein